MRAESTCWLTGDPWVLQTGLDAIAYALNIPLQALDLTSADNLWPTINKAQPVFADEASFRAYVERIASDPYSGMIAVRRNALLWRALIHRDTPGLWLTRCSNPSPILAKLRDHWAWYWWESLWFYRQVLHPPPASPAQVPYSTSFGGFLHDTFRVGCIPIPHHQLLLVSMPLVSHGSGTQLSTAFQRLLSAIHAGGATPIHDIRALVQAAKSRSSISQTDFTLRLLFSTTCHRNPLHPSSPISASTDSAEYHVHRRSCAFSD